MNPLLSNVFNNSLSHSFLILIAKLSPLLIEVSDSRRVKDCLLFCVERFPSVFVVAYKVFIMLLHALVNMP